ncbi:hypothetical protein O181_019608 [Austropuccinia psidii MF-1]|uniref:Uncharacterized protein n=1 Tax=Austropuccinia psidii MF-1 TaxID=1389203 RepID=A0A9Q3CBC8_9BASI|nr:hypothetical protein [Austropuccinia psidii MF-1]
MELFGHCVASIPIEGVKPLEKQTNGITQEPDLGRLLKLKKNLDDTDDNTQDTKLSAFERYKPSVLRFPKRLEPKTLEFLESIPETSDATEEKFFEKEEKDSLLNSPMVWVTDSPEPSQAKGDIVTYVPKAKKKWFSKLPSAGLFSMCRESPVSLPLDKSAD